MGLKRSFHLGGVFSILPPHSTAQKPHLKTTHFTLAGMFVPIFSLSPKRSRYGLSPKNISACIGQLLWISIILWSSDSLVSDHMLTNFKA